MSSPVSSGTYAVAVVGGGIVGLATARALACTHRVSVVVLEAERALAQHQSGHNSGVIHSGLYYRPGSSKATNCTAGREAMYRFCEDEGIAHERCGKVVVATQIEEIPRLEELERRGRANGLQQIRRLTPEALCELEPHARGVAGLFVGETGIVDYGEVSTALARQIRERDGSILTNARLTRVSGRAGAIVLETPRGEIRARTVVNCAGLRCDRVARLCGIRPRLRIIPFRGEYYVIRPERQHLVRNLIYPVPDPRFPFLGVHFTRMIRGGVEAGPNAVLAFRREGYTRWSISPRELWWTLGWPGFWKLAARYWRTGLIEWNRSLRRGVFARDLARLVPGIGSRDIVPRGAGVRAQAVGRDGGILDDFAVEQAEGQLHVLNAPSPAATASLSIGETLARQAVAVS